LTISNSYLVTCSSKRVGRYVNIYDLASGKLLSTHTCSAGSDVTLARLSADEQRLYLADPDLVIRVYSGNGFVDQLTSSSPVDALSPRVKNYTIRDLLMSPFDPMIVVLRFNDSGTVAGSARYAHVDLTTGRRGQTVATPNGAPLEDVSRDCRVGVDDRLSLYDMREGTIKVYLQYTDAVDGARVQVY
jgi:hypothetical protein